MNYPDLMFLAGSSGVKIDTSVFEDLKLTAMIREDIIEAMRTPCGAQDIIARQSMFRSIANPETRAHIKKLSQDIDTVSSLAERFAKARCDNEKHIIYLNLAQAVSLFFSDAAFYECDNILYKRFRDYFVERLNRENYKQLAADVAQIIPKAEGALQSNFKLADNTLRISAEIPETYMAHLLICASNLGLSGVQSQHMVPKLLDPTIINAMARLYPEIFAGISAFYNKHKNFFEPEILRYKVEIDFYLVMADVFDRIHAAGIPMSFPKITDTKRIDIINAYDVTLITKGETSVIPNDIYFDESEPFFYLTGANGGGKTTYLRTVGVTCLLFINGCPAPCDRAEIFPLSSLFTHFPHDERFNNTGRYAEEQSRIDIILNSISETTASEGCSLVLLNETYSTTSEEKARSLTTSLADRLYHSGDFGVYVTHQHNVGETEIPYLNVLIDHGDQNRRTFKVAKQKSVYSSYAYDILKKYALTKEDLDRRFK
jgi:DNA mismatch repair protein MutS